MTRVHIFGASGSGTTTLGRAVADAVRCPHFDSDSYFWMPTDPPFRTIRDRAERQALLLKDLERCESWVLSGSLCGWGDIAIPMFDLVVFLWLPQDVRMRRLEQREIERYGPAIEEPSHPDGKRHREFLEWAAAYDDGGLEMRSRAQHEKWMTDLPCPLLRIEQDRTVRERLDSVLAKILSGCID